MADEIYQRMYFLLSPRGEKETIWKAIKTSFHANSVKSICSHFSSTLLHYKTDKKQFKPVDPHEIQQEKKIWGIRRWEVPSQVYKPSLNVNTSQISGEFIFKNMRKVTFSPSRKFPGQRNALGFARGSFWFLYL